MFPEPIELEDDGHFSLTDIKQIAVTEEFLNYNEERKTCDIIAEIEKNCIMKAYLENGIQKCGCISFKLKSFSNVRETAQPILFFS